MNSRRPSLHPVLFGDDPLRPRSGVRYAARSLSMIVGRRGGDHGAVPRLARLRYFRQDVRWDGHALQRRSLSGRQTGPSRVERRHHLVEDGVAPETAGAAPAEEAACTLARPRWPPERYGGSSGRSTAGSPTSRAAGLQPAERAINEVNAGSTASTPRNCSRRWPGQQRERPPRILPHDS